MSLSLFSVFFWEVECWGVCNEKEMANLVLSAISGLLYTNYLRMQSLSLLDKVLASKFFTHSKLK